MTSKILDTLKPLFELVPEYSRSPRKKLQLVRKLQAIGAEEFITATYGPRCETTDKEDFPETDFDDPKNGRCACCEMWEIYDDYMSKK